jgi:hypothetical protein
MPEERRKPEEIILAGKLTLKDYLDLRDLRLLIWNLKDELCEKHGITKACDIAEKIKPIVEAKLKELEAKL